MSQNAVAVLKSDLVAARNAMKAAVSEHEEKISKLERVLDLLQNGKVVAEGKKRGRPRKNGDSKPSPKPAPKTETPDTGEKRGRGRPMSETSLRAYVTNVLRAATGPMEPKSIAEAVLAAGYQTENKSLNKTVSILLPKIDGASTVSRGQWVIKSS